MIIANYTDNPPGEKWNYNINSYSNINSVIVQAQCNLQAALDNYPNLRNYYLAMSVGTPNQRIYGPQIKDITRTINDSSVKISVETRPFFMVSDLRVYFVWLINPINLFVAPMIGNSVILSNGESHQLNFDFGIL